MVRAADADGPTGTVPLFTPILPPMIESVSHEALVRWKRERRDYESKMQARCRVTGEDYEAVVQSIKDSFQPQLLDVFCDLKLNVQPAEATEGMLLAEIEHIVHSIKNDTLPDIKELFKKNLVINLRESDVNARLIDYYKVFNSIVDENGLAECFSGPNGTKEKCKRLIANLLPKALKQEVKQCVRFTHADAAKDPKVLFRLILDKANELERQHVRLKREKRDVTGQSKDKSKSNQSDKKKRWDPKPASAAASKGDADRASTESKPKATFSKPKPTSSGPSKPPPGPCPKCQEMHWLRECTQASRQEKEELYKKMRDGRGNKKAKTKRLGELLPPADRVVMLNGVLELPYCLDSGSDYTVIGHSHWEQLKTLDPSVSAEELEVPILNQTFGSTTVTAKLKAKLHLMLHTAAGPVEPMKMVDVLVVDIDDGEFIVGNDLLTSLGIDVDHQLEQLATRCEDETSGDPIDLEADEMPVNLDASNSSGDDDIFAAVERLIDRALANGFPVEYVEQLRTTAHAYDIWRLELRDDPPANVPPLEVRLKEGARPTKCKPRKYPPHIRKFLREFNARLVDLGLVYENPKSRWASPVLPVKKSADIMDLRQTTDYRARNEQTEVMAAVMPILSLVLENARDMKHFGLFDFLKGFWQLPLAELCQEFMSYMTDEKIFTPRRVPQGCADAAIHFQKTMEECFASLLYEHLLIWIDDLLLYADDIEVYLEKLSELFSLLNQFGLKLSVKKSSLYQTEVKWCGRVINHQGVRHDPARIDTLRSLPYPTTAGELQQFVCAINWMRESLVDFARKVAPLQRRLDEALASTKRTRRAAAGIEIKLNEEERQAFDQVKELLATSTTLDFPDDNATTCLFTDASDIGWAAIVTQVKEYDPKRPVTEQQHRLIQCLSGTFTGSQLNWTVIEKEALPIVLACEKMDYLLLRPQPFRMFCDHRNLIHVFAPHESVKKHVKGKLLRWAMKLMNFRYIIEHVPGPDNVWADMISRWAGNHTPVASVKRIKAVRRRTAPTRVKLRPLDDENFVWPTLEELCTVQSQYEQPTGSSTAEDGTITLGRRIWVPSEASELIQRLCIVAHCGAQGHRGQKAMITHLNRLFVIDNVAVIVKKFVKDCLLCLHCRGGKIIPRPWGEVINCSTRNQVLHFDFLSMGPSYGDSKYILVLKDHATHYCELVVADTADSRVTVEALLAWHSRFGIPPDWMSDQGTHFKNEVVAELSRRLRTQQTFTPAYCPWINGSVERVNRDILQVIRAMIITYKISQKDWVYLVPMVQANLNHTAVPSLGNHSPLELFTGLQNPTPLREFYLPGCNNLQTIPESEEIDGYLAELRESIQVMHCAVEDQRLKQRLLNKKRERGENLVNFSVGDFVLRSRVDEKHGNKLQVTWVGPYRVVRADVHSFRVQHLVTGDEMDVHPSRLKMYADESLEVTDELLEHVSSQGIVLAVDKLKDHRWNNEIKDFEIQVGWKGLQPIEDSYEPLSDLAKEIRVLVDNYVKQSDDQKLLEAWNKLHPSGEQRRADSATVYGDRRRVNATAASGDRQQVDTTAPSSDGRGKCPNKRPARRQQTGRKRRRSVQEQDVQQNEAILGEGSAPHEGVQSSLGQTATGLDREHGLDQPVGRQTRSMTATAGITAIPCSTSSRSTRRRRDRGQRS